MPLHDLVNRLVRVQGDPVVTITAALDRRRPGNNEDRIRLRNLHAQAKSEVLKTRSSRDAGPLLDGLASAVDDVDLAAGANGVVVVATRERAESHLLPFPVADSVSIDATAATRYLVQGLRRIPRYPRPARRGARPRFSDARRRCAARPASGRWPLRVGTRP